MNPLNTDQEHSLNLKGIIKVYQSIGSLNDISGSEVGFSYFDE